MMRDAADNLNASGHAGQIVARRFPDETIKLCTAATILEAPDEQPIGWSLRRLLQRRGTVVLTDRRAFIQSSFRSPLTLLWAGVLAWAVYGLATSDRSRLPFLALAAGLLFQRRPYTRNLLYSELRAVRLGSVVGVAGRFDILVLGARSGAIHLVTARAVPDELRRAIEAAIVVQDPVAESADKTQQPTDRSKRA
jgi:hypothetical protein